MACYEKSVWCCGGVPDSCELATRPSHWWAKNHMLQLPQLHPSFQSPTFATQFSRDEVRKIDGGTNLQNFKRIETTQTICNMRVDYECTLQQLHILSFRCNYSLSNVPVNTDVIHHLLLLPALFGMLALIAMFFWLLHRSLKGPIIQTLDFSQLSLIDTCPTSRCHWCDLYMFHLIPWQAAALELSQFI